MYLIFDTETTGLPKNWRAPVTDLSNWPRIVQLAWEEYDIAEEQISAKEYIIKPKGFTIPDSAVNVHGITTERATKEGVDLRTVLNEFSEVIDKSEVLVAHNMSFDKNVIGAEFIRENIQNKLFETKSICTKETSTNYCKLPGNYGYKWPTLSELYFKLFDKDFEEAHNASVDVNMCTECFFELKIRGII